MFGSSTLYSMERSPFSLICPDDVSPLSSSRSEDGSQGEGGSDLDERFSLSEITMEERDFQTIFKEEVSLRIREKNGSCDFGVEDIEKIWRGTIYQLEVFEAKRNGKFLTRCEYNQIRKKIEELVYHGVREISERLKKEKKYFSVPIVDALIVLSTPRQICLQTDANAICDEKTQNTWLHFAAEMENESMLKGFIEYGDSGLNLEVKNREGFTPFMLAIKNGKEKSMEILLDAGVDVHAFVNEQMSTLHMAAQMDVRIIDLIFRKRVGRLTLEVENDKGETPLFSAIVAKRVDVVERLIREGANIHKFNQLQTAYPLSVAASIGQGKIIEILLKNGATIIRYNTKDWEGMSPLFEAVQSPEISDKSIYALIRAGDDPFRRLIGKKIRPKSKNLVFFALSKAPLEILRILLEVYRINPDREDIWNTCFHGGVTRMNLLLQHGADPNVILEEGKYFVGHTLLGRCSMGLEKDDPDKIVALLNHGADPNGYNEKHLVGVTVSRYTSFAEFADNHSSPQRYLASRAFELTELFLSKGAKITRDIKRKFDASYLVRSNLEFRGLIDRHYQSCTIM